MSWCFAIINNKLTEIYFDETKHGSKICGYCYVKKSEYKTKQEQRWIKEDTAKFRFIYRRGEYKRIKPELFLGKSIDSIYKEAKKFNKKK